VALLLAAGTACQIAFTIINDEFFHGGFSYYVKPWNRSQPYLLGLLLGTALHKLRDQPTLPLSRAASLLCWAAAGALGSAVVYGVSEYNIVANPSVAIPCTTDHPPMAARVIFNGFAKIGWAVALSWLILACVKQRGGLVDNILSWSGWVPLARVQYCVYLLHRTIVYIVNSYVTTTVRYSNLHLTQQFLSILAISTGAAFLFVIMFEAPIVHLEKLLFAVAGVGRLPQRRKDPVRKEK